MNKREEVTYICGETAIKPYYYMRNGILHARYTVDRAIELSKEEENKVKEDLTKAPWDKQNILSKAWNFFDKFVGKTVWTDGIKIGEEKMRELSEEYESKNGR